MIPVLLSIATYFLPVKGWKLKGSMTVTFLTRSAKETVDSDPVCIIGVTCTLPIAAGRVVPVQTHVQYVVWINSVLCMHATYSMYTSTHHIFHSPSRSTLHKCMLHARVTPLTRWLRKDDWTLKFQIDYCMSNCEWISKGNRFRWLAFIFWEDHQNHPGFEHPINSSSSD